MEYVPILAERERIAEDILTNKQLIIDYDRTRNANREALNKLKKEKDEKKVWVNLGEFFIKMDKNNVKTYIEKDQESLDSGISSLRETVKEKMAELEKLETGDDKISKGFKLRGISSDELYNITK
ncbi:p53 and DNA damage-regulated protein 1 [Gigaspora margarita]|uniref:p53 and DNA damage-regulated protein 1 n=1 Tax=Gigaspora margarita TaxID=4874 RepID=A0A8H3XLE1_GIGMA|nr:p53 and DNA damage-regulated protein 1 [Gigaspora margarita]